MSVAESSGSRRLAGDLGDTSKRVRVAHRDVSEHLTVELHAGQLEAVHQLRVAHVVKTRRRVDARDPQPAKVTLAVAPVAVGVRVGLQQGLLGAPVVGVRLAAKALGQGKRRAALLACAHRALDAGHLPTPSMRLTRGTSCSCRIAGRPSARFFLGDFFSRIWLVKAWRARTLPPPVTLKRFLAPECVFILGIRSGNEVPGLTTCGRLRHPRGADYDTAPRFAGARWLGGDGRGGGRA